MILIRLSLYHELAIYLLYLPGEMSNNYTKAKIVRHTLDGMYLEQFKCSMTEIELYNGCFIYTGSSPYDRIVSFINVSWSNNRSHNVPIKALAA